MKGTVTKRFRAVREGSIHPVWIEAGTEVDGELADIARQIGALDAAPPSVETVLGAPAKGALTLPAGVAATVNVESENPAPIPAPAPAPAKAPPPRRARLLKKWVDEADDGKPGYAKGAFVEGEIADRAVAANAAVMVAALPAAPETK